MADQFFDREAEVSDGSEDEEVRKETSKSSKRRSKFEDSEEEEEEDEDQLREVMHDLINDEEEEPAEDSDEEQVTGRKRQREDDLEENLDDEDYDLIEENLGRRIERKKKFRRIRRLEDDDEDEDKNDGQDDREAIANELFNDDEDTGQQPSNVRRDRSDREAIDDRFAELSDSGRSDDSDEDNFIVDDDDRPIQPRVRKPKSQRFTDEALQQAQDIFGVDFDFDEIQNFDETGADYDDEEEDDDYEEGGDQLDDTQRSERSKRKSKRRSARKSIFEIYEPSELERSHLTRFDNDIRNADIPERFQLRSVPVTPCDEQELTDEADWVYDNVFQQNTISVQDESGEGKHEPIGGRKSSHAVPKIREALRFIRNELLEVPFIIHYRKEYVEPELTVSDLWLIYKFDEKWCQLQTRKSNLSQLYRNMQAYQTEQIMKDPDAPLPEGMRLINDVDIERLISVKTFEELRDCWLHFQLYYSSDVPNMKKEILRKERQRKLNETQTDGEDGGGNNTVVEDDELLMNSKMSSMKLAQRKDTYTICKEANIIGLVAKFGLTPEQFGENLRDNYQRHEVEQYPVDPHEAAHDYICHRFPTSDKVLQAATFMVAKQISSDPIVRKNMRSTYFERAHLHARPTRKGIKEIDENHPCYQFKYLLNKPIIDFGGDQFLQIMIAKTDGLIEFEITIDKLDMNAMTGQQQQPATKHKYYDEIKQLYHRDEFSINVQQWNHQRATALEIALDKFLYPSFEKELKTKLMIEAQEAIINQCVHRLSSWIRVAPYQLSPEAQIEEDEEFDTRDGIRVMGLAFVANNENASFAAVVDGDGEVTDYVKLEYFMLRKAEWVSDNEKALREKDVDKLKKFILNKKPHVIGVGCDTIITRYVIDDIKAIVAELNESDQFPQIAVEYVDNELSTVYMNSKKALIDFHNYPPHLRQAISLARRLQDPLIEYSQLCTADEEILCIKYHPLQEHLPRDELLNSLYLEFVNQVNELGVDINRSIVHPHTSQLVQFIGGLGPRKGAYLIRTLKKQQTPLLENRTQLVQNCNIGKVVFINCAGFIKIDTASLSDSGTDTYIEVLDSTRVHPEAYEWARKMAVDALEYDEDNDTNPAQALEEIIENPEKLKDLDLDAFAEELNRQGMGLKTITLYDIRSELSNRYKDHRIPYRPPNAEEIFKMLTGETHDSFYTGKLVMGRVLRVARRKPKSDQLDQANPVRNDETGLWMCPFCSKSDFPELSDVWNHFDAGNCLGQAVGIMVRLDNGLMGLVTTKLISDKEVTDPLSRVTIGMTIHCRIVKIQVEKFSVDLTCRTSDLTDSNFQWRPPRDKDFYYEAEDKDVRQEEQHKKRQGRQSYVKRIIVHPAFHNIDFRQAEKLLSTMDQGEAIIRPSSKANDHLTLTWKVHNGVHHHIDIREEGKDNAFSLGHELYINNESYEDLDEILARYVQPMASYARDIINYKYFKDGDIKREDMDRILKEEKKKAPSRIPYFVSVSKEFPGKFLLSYQPNLKSFHEFISVTPDGFRYRNTTFRSVPSLFKWFKIHFNDRSTFPQRTPVATPVMRTPAGQSSHGSIATPNIDPQAIQRAAASMSNQVFNALSQVAGQTPSFGGAAAAFGGGPPPGHSMGTPFGQGGGGGRNYYGQGTSMQNMMTPTMSTPRNYQPTTPGSMPPPQHIPTSSHQRPGSRSGSQWANLAADRGRSGGQQQQQRTPHYATPGASSQMSISPNTNTPNTARGGGDQTPLVDEWN
ncbi:transcription elongation factor SPT6-like [Oppia nitens]|uniref:transcription elongation factor SPT6-like n=1 Tax=Oppia nitens TaxID=1686743 RepID=UPI0023DAB2D1|nr:transcription elongation factor SPT6-like [Oppia nitens]